MQTENRTEEPPRRSAGSLRRRRVQLDWPTDRNFRILSLDGGGIRGIFTAAYLSGLEQRFLSGKSVASYFDLITGTSTGGIIALGLASGFTATELLAMYISRGNEIFPPVSDNALGRIHLKLRDLRQWVYYSYDQKALVGVLTDYLGSKKFGEASTRLCVPAFEGRHGEVLVFKTPHHPDFKLDLHEDMVNVGLATAAAPTFFRPLEKDGYVLVDGGVWANNPIMIGLVDALSCYALPRENIRILSVGCGYDPYYVSSSMRRLGGIFHWRKIITAAMNLQSQNAIGQSCLLIGAENVSRIDRSQSARPIRIDDWRTAHEHLPFEAEQELGSSGEQVAELFLGELAAPFTRHHTVN